MKRAPVFAETYRSYLQQLEMVDLAGRADRLGVLTEGDSLLIALFDRQYRVSARAIVDEAGESVSPSVSVILARYVLNCPPQIPAAPDPLMSYREFPDAAPLVSYFTTTTLRAIEKDFSGAIDCLRKRGVALGGTCGEQAEFDLTLHFLALPRIPVQLNFNDQDELFPAACSVLYRQSAASFLDMECLAMTGTLLAERLAAR